MYSDADIDAAVAAGVLEANTAEALRAHIASLRASPAADEEQFRLITGFNDIFVTIACALVIFAAAAIGGETETWIGALLVAGASWVMAEYFTRVRRMALPSIVLLLAFTIGLGMAAGDLVGYLVPPHVVEKTYNWGNEVQHWTSTERYPWEYAAMVCAGGMAALVGAAAHWMRFRVAITIAAGIGAAVLLLLAMLAAATNQDLESNAVIAPAAFACGLAVFAYAMRWDLSDPKRRTLNADIAFWLHLLAAPLIAHPLFYWMGVMDGSSMGTATALGVLAIYVLFAVVALAVDRRALLVSALVYVMVALGQLFVHYGAIKLGFALTSLVIGSALLMLSAFWSTIRLKLVPQMPDAIRSRLPGGSLASG